MIIVFQVLMKDTIRREISSLRKSLSSSDVATKSMLIKSRLIQLDEYHTAEIILFYLSCDNEVMTHDLVKEHIAQGKTAVVPVCDVKKKKIVVSRLDSWDDLHPGAFHILEPKKNKIHDVSLKDIQLIIVPGVAFDISGNRIGHGQGYYDRLLAASKDTLKIGLAFELQLVEHIPAEKHDVVMNKIVTEKRVIHCFD